MTENSLEIRLDRIDGRLQNLETRLTAVEQKLPTLATKDDLKGFVTKDDSKRFATKQDLKRFATKEDLKRFATKEDLKRFATKDDLRTSLEREGAAMRAFVLEVTQKLATDLRSEMRVLFEAQNQKLDAFLDLYKTERERIDEVDAGSRHRDAALSRRVERLERA